MPRRSSSGGKSARPAPRSAARSPPPRKVNRAHAPAPVQGSSGDSLLGSIGASIADGMSFGTGNAVAHRVVDAIFGPRTIRHEPVASAPVPAPAPVPALAPAPTTMSDACSTHSKAFHDCLNVYSKDISKCQFYIDMLAECRRNSGPVQSF